MIMMMIMIIMIIGFPPTYKYTPGTDELNRSPGAGSKYLQLYPHSSKYLKSY